MRYLLFFLLFAPGLASSQLSWDGNTYTLESSLFVSSDSTLPFWMRSQTFGEVPVASQFLQLKASVQHDFDSTYNRDQQLQKFGLGHGASVIANLGMVNQLLISEAYVKSRYGVFEFWAGRRREIIGLVDSTLSTGSLIWGGNAIPIPKIQLAIPNYTSILGKGLVSIKGFYAHGWFGSTDSVRNYLLHQKSLYARMGRPNWKFKFYAGFNHQVQWGGAPAVPFFDAISKQTISSFQSDFATYLQVVSGISLNRKGDQLGGTNGVAANEALNRSGNHLGTLDIAFDYEFDKVKLFVYRQSIYEDGSLFYLSNIKDGLLGLSLTTKEQIGSGLRFKKLNIEFLDSRSQGGAGGSRNVIPELRGQDNYFNNSLYEDGWTYKSRPLANAFFLPIAEYANLVSNPERFISTRIFNSRLRAFSISSDFSYKQHNFITRYSRSNNEGNYGFVLDQLIQHSIYFGWNAKLNKYSLKAAIASDWGDFLGNRTGINIGLVRNLYL